MARTMLRTALTALALAAVWPGQPLHAQAGADPAPRDARAIYDELRRRDEERQRRQAAGENPDADEPASESPPAAPPPAPPAQPPASLQGRDANAVYEAIRRRDQQQASDQQAREEAYRRQVEDYQRQLAATQAAQHEFDEKQRRYEQERAAYEARLRQLDRR